MNREPLRIVYQLNSITVGGMEYHVADLASGMKGRGHEPVVVLPGWDELDRLVTRLREEGIEVHRVGLHGRQSWWHRWQSWWQLRQLLRRLRPDVVHQHRTGPYHGQLAALAARAAAVPVVVATEHQPAFRQHGFSRWFTRAADYLLDRILTVSDYDYRQQLEQSDRPPGKVTRIYNGLDLRVVADLSPIEICAERQELGVPANAPVIGAVARLEEQKGIDLLLEAAARVGERWPDLQVILVGDGSLRDELEAQAARLGIGERVHFLGHQPQGARFIPLMDVFVLSSNWESFGITLIEAMASRRPVVATDVGGVPEVVSEGETGTIVPADDPEALAEAIGRYLADERLRERTGRAGRRLVEQRFSLEAMTDHMLELYCELLREKGAPCQT